MQLHGAHYHSRGYSALSADERVFVLANLVNGVDRYHFPSMDYLDSLEFPVSRPLKLFQVAIDGSQVVVGGERGTVRVFEGATGLVQETLRHPEGKCTVRDDDSSLHWLQWMGRCNAWRYSEPVASYNFGTDTTFTGWSW